MTTPAERLVVAENAYADLMTGRMAVEFRDANGETLRYNLANASRLRQYIEDLKREVAGTSAVRRPPFRPVFG